MSTEQLAVKKRKKRRWGRKVRNWLVGLIGPIILRAWMGSLRLRCDPMHKVINGIPQGPGPGIYVFWHQHVVLLTGLFRDSGFYVLISQHGDGEMLARVVKGLGMHSFRGSSTRGGARAAREIIREVANSGKSLSLGVTPDGPKGPRHVFQNGAIYLASRTGLPIYPVAVVARRHWKLPTWDGLILPLPFTAALVRLGPTILVPKDADRDGIEAHRKDAEGILRELLDSTEKNFEALYAAGRRT